MAVRRPLYQDAGSIYELDPSDSLIGRNIPLDDEKDALAGTHGTPSSTNKYVTDSDPRNTNARTPTGSAGGVLAGTYPNPGFATKSKSISLGVDEISLTANPPAMLSYQVVVALLFDDSSQEQGFIQLIVPSDIKSNSDMELHFHFFNVQSQTGDKVCRWGVEYVTIDPGEDYDSKTRTTKTVDVTLGTNESARVFHSGYVTLNYNDTNNPLDKKILLARIYRDATHANDTMVGDAALTDVEFRYQTDKLGS